MEQILDDKSSSTGKVNFQKLLYFSNDKILIVIQKNLSIECIPSQQIPALHEKCTRRLTGLVEKYTFMSFVFVRVHSFFFSYFPTAFFNKTDSLLPSHHGGCSEVNKSKNQIMNKILRPEELNLTEIFNVVSQKTTRSFFPNVQHITGFQKRRFIG